MANRYEITQLRYEPFQDEPICDGYPILFASVEEARARVKRDGIASMFEHTGDTHYISELQPFRNGVILTGRQFELEV
jgi:hypothetical protein